EKIWAQLGQAGPLADVRIDQLTHGALRVGTRIGELAPTFPRVEHKETLEKIMTLEGEMTKPQAEKGAAPAHPTAAHAAAAGTPAAPAGAAAPAAGTAAPLAGG